MELSRKVFFNTSWGYIHLTSTHPSQTKFLNKKFDFINKEEKVWQPLIRHKQEIKSTN